MAITFGSVVKALAVGAVGCTVAVIAPLGVVAVVAITAGTAAASLAVDSAADKMKNKDGDKSK